MHVFHKPSQSPTAPMGPAYLLSDVLLTAAEKLYTRRWTSHLRSI